MSMQPEALRLADLLDRIPSYGHTPADTAAAAELRRLHAQNQVLTAKLDHARAQYESAAKLLRGIHALLYPAPLKLEDGRVMVFRPEGLDPHQLLQELSDRIRALPDKLAAGLEELAPKGDTRISADAPLSPASVEELVHAAQAFVLEPDSIRKKLELEALAWGPLAREVAKQGTPPSL